MNKSQTKFLGTGISPMQTGGASTTTNQQIIIDKYHSVSPNGGGGLTPSNQAINGKRSYEPLAPYAAISSISNYSTNQDYLQSRASGIFD